MHTFVLENERRVRGYTKGGSNSVLEFTNLERVEVQPDHLVARIHRHLDGARWWSLVRRGGLFRALRHGERQKVDGCLQMKW